MLAAAAEAYGDGPALRIARGETSVVTSYASMGERVRNIAAGLVAAGIEPGDRVALFSPNCPEWTIADHAILAAGAITVPIYATSTPAQARHILG
ncbi:MAG: long-chain fatty acid--CoA ligase, partial [Micrococcales bacterium]